MRFRRMICLLVALMLLVSWVPVATSAASVTLAPGSHIRWIDRIGDLPDYARRFYSWLESNADVDGALADPTKGLCVAGEYVYRLEVLSGCVSVGASASDTEIQTAVLAATDDPSQQIMDYAFEVYGAFDRDHPEIFWLSGKSLCGMNLSYSHNKSTGVVSYEMTVCFCLKSADFDIRAEQYRNVSDIRSAATRRDRDIDRILADCPKNEGPAEQVRYLNQVLTQTNGYNSAANSGGTAPDSAWKCISALSGCCGSSGPVCEGYARAFKVLCDRLGIPCVLTEGQARNYPSSVSQPHMWNYVRIDGKWYAVDVTWNDPVVEGREQYALSGRETETYLLIGSATQACAGLVFSTSHRVTNRVSSLGVSYTNGPKLSDSAYVFNTTEIDPVPTPDPLPTPDPNPVPTPDPNPVPTPDPLPTPDLDPVPLPNPQPSQKPDNVLDETEIIAEWLPVACYRSDNYTAPQKDGYVFTGWFTDAQLTVPLGKNVTEGEAYAGFAKAEILCAKCQIAQGADTNSDATDLRLLTGVESLRLSAVVFLVNGEFRTATELYERLSYGDLSARDLFGPEAVYIASAVINGISRDHFNDVISIIPGWYTLDGTFVTGTPRSLRLSDGLS